MFKITPNPPETDDVSPYDFAGQLNGAQRPTLLGIQQSVMFGELAVNRMLDNFDPQNA